MRQQNKSKKSFVSRPATAQSGFTLIELLITIMVLTVLALGTLPLIQNAVQRQKEQQLRETLREIRTAIDEFHQDARTCALQNPTGGGGQQASSTNRVVISDCKIFEVDNYDKYPPTLEILVEGVEVTPVNGGGQLIGGKPFDDKNPSDNKATEPKKKKYLRELPIDPITGESDWILRSPYQEGDDDGSWDNISVFDVRSSAKGEAMNGKKYSEF